MTQRLFDDPDPGASDERSGLHVGGAAPLAARMRPRTLAEYVGQTDVLGEGAQLRTLLERDELTSLILWGPPGSGKTSLAAVIAATTDAAWAQLSAVSASVKDVRAIIAEATTRRETSDRATVLFLDEIHRFNKSQQDALLPAVESGTIVLVGATTENPFFELNAPLLSRCRLVRLEALTDADIGHILDNALTDPERGYGGRVEITDAARDHLVAAADGDARVALGALEAAVDAVADDEGTVRIDVEDVTAALATKRLRYDKSGDAHYDEVSAFIKSMRGSDPDAAVYWLVRMLEAGEDPRFLARRMVIFASEDVGLADPNALQVAVAAFEALDRVGLPEARLNLVHAALVLATAAKSNSVIRALGAADRAVADVGNAPVPAHLRDAHYRGARKIGHGEGYRYPHDYPGGHISQQYLPDVLAGRRLYEPSGHGDEAEIAERVETWRATTEQDQQPESDENGETT